MAHISLYRRFRPISFKDVIGQEHITRILTNQIKSNSIGHCYLFTGARGTGKTSVAKIFSRAINCLSSVDGSPCGICDLCNMSLNANNLDIYELDAASNNGVDEIRQLIELTTFQPVSLKYKVFIIDEVHMLSNNAFNALLKTLEEPPSYCVFILATTEVHKLPETILSRCLTLDFRLISQDVLASRLKYVLDTININYKDDGINLIASLGEGSVRDMLSIAEMCLAYCGDNLEYDKIIEIMGLSDPRIIINLISYALSYDLKSLIDLLDKLIKDGKSVKAIFNDIIYYISKIFFIKNNGNVNDLPIDILNAAQSVAVKHNNSSIIRALNIMTNAEGQLRYSENQRAFLESRLLQFGDSSVDIDADGLLLRVKSLESQLSELKSSNIVGNNIAITENINTVSSIVENTKDNIKHNNSAIVKNADKINNLTNNNNSDITHKNGNNATSGSVTDNSDITLKYDNNAITSSNVRENNSTIVRESVTDNSDITHKSDNNATTSRPLSVSDKDRDAISNNKASNNISINTDKIDTISDGSIDDTQSIEQYAVLDNDNIDRVWGQLITDLRLKGMMTLHFFAAEISKKVINGNSLTIYVKNAQDLDIFNKAEYKSYINSFILKHYKSGIVINYAAENDNSQDRKIIEEVKELFDEFSLKIEK